MNPELIERIEREHEKRFGTQASALSYAPGRIEVLGNHTDYNEGFTLSSAIDLGIAAALSRRRDGQCVLSALDTNDEFSLKLPAKRLTNAPVWANYIIGVLAELNRFGLDKLDGGFNVTIAGNIPMAAGLSSSAALEVAAALGFRSIAGIHISELETAKLCQTAEHDFTGTKCGLLDQLSSLFGKEGALVFCDFRSLRVETETLGPNACFLVVNTGVKHNLVDSEYNERRARCEQAAEFFASRLGRSVKALRDVSLEEWKRFHSEMDPVTARRAAHIIEENRRVLEGRRFLAHGDIAGFGGLMFESHESSRLNFENSCPELDMIVSAARELKSVLGARLSGGGFGGSAILLVHPDDANETACAIQSRYASAFGDPCEVCVVKPSDGATALKPARPRHDDLAMSSGQVP